MVPGGLERASINPFQGEEGFMTTLQIRGARPAALGLAAALALGLAAAPAFAGSGKAVRGAGARTPVNGMQVAIDPATGKIRRPTAAESRALSVPIAKSATADLQFTTWPDGTMSAVLTEDYLNVWLVQLNADGSANQVCVDGANASQQSLAPAFEEK
jgi:hypothetical protein